jgi:hypothetical protein
MKEILEPYLELISREAEILVGTLRERGAQRFGRAFGAAGFMIFAAFMLVFRPAQTKSDRLDAEINRARTLYENAEKYKEMRDQLQGAYARLPTEKDRAQWLFNSVHESLEKSGLVTENIRSVQEQEVSGLVYQSLGVALNVRFPDFYDWLLRVENARPAMHLQTVDISKKNSIINELSIGYNETSCTIGTVIPKKRYQ